METISVIHRMNLTCKPHEYILYTILYVHVSIALINFYQILVYELLPDPDPLMNKSTERIGSLTIS